MMTREQELRAGVKKSGLSDRDKLLFTVILDAAQFGSADFKDQKAGNFIPSVAKLAKLCEKNVRTIQRSLNHLESHGWIDRHGHAGGRGRPSRLTLGLGERCECPKAGGARKPCQLEPSDQPERVTTCAAKGCQAAPPKGDTLIHVSAGEVPISTMGHVAGGMGGGYVSDPWPNASRSAPDESWKSWPTGSTGEEMATFGIQATA